MKTKRGNITVISVIIIIVAITAGIIGFMIAKKTEVPVQKVVINPQPVNVISNSQVVKSDNDESANWQKYNNEKYGFKLDYPNNMTMVETKFEASGIISPLSRVDFKFDSESVITVYVWNKQTSPISGSDIKSLAINGFNEITVGGQDAIRGRDYGNAYFIETYVNNGDYTYQIEYAGEEVKSNISVYDKILSDFKFIN